MRTTHLSSLALALAFGTGGTAFHLQADTPVEIFKAFNDKRKTPSAEWTLAEAIALQQALNANALTAITNKFAKLGDAESRTTELPEAVVKEAVGVPLPKPTSVLDKVSDFIALQKSYLGGDVSEDPAKLSWTVSRHDTSYAFDGALVFKKIPLLFGIGGDSRPSPEAVAGANKIYSVNYRDLGGAWTLDVVPVIEAHVSNLEDASSDTVTAALPLRFVRSLRSPAPLGLTSFQLELTPQYQTDSGFRAKTFEANPLVTVTQPNWGMGTDLQFGNFKDVRFRWQPYAGMELGTVLDDGGNAALIARGTIARFVTKIHSELALGTRFTVTADFGYRHLLNDDHHDYLFGEVSPQVKLDANNHVTAGVTFKTGKQPLTFEDEHAVNLWVGFKF